MPTTDTDHTVPHVSTVPANQGEPVGLFVRERNGTRPNHTPQPVLMVHGRSTPALAGFDLRHGKYSWAEHLADAGYDVFIMDLQGSGLSPRPKMEDPCNANPAQQSALLVPNPLGAPCPPVYTSQLNNSDSDWDELHAVVEYIKQQRKVLQVALIGWSAAAFQIGPYTLRHPENVSRVLFLAPVFPPKGRAGTAPDGFGAPVTLPVSSPEAVFGFPMNLGTKEAFAAAWDREQHCPRQREPGMVDVVWNAIMDNDEYGRKWGPVVAGQPQGVTRIRNAFWWGWNATTVPFNGILGNTVPVLIVYGDQDAQINTSPDLGLLHWSVPALYNAIPGAKKLMFRIACAGHNVVWERQHKVVHRMSSQWLKHTAVDGLSQGSYFLDEDGVYVPAG